MGGVILIVLVGLAVVILLTPAMRARARERRNEVAKAAEDAVVRRIEDHKEWRGGPGADSSSRKD
jgi:hypothetical protein